MPPSVFIILGIVAVVSLVGGLIWLSFHIEKKRTEALHAVAAELGMDFSATQDHELLNRLQAFSLFNKGRGRKLKNVMKAATELAQLTIFDYQYTTGSGKNSHTYRHTVVAMQSDLLSLPNFTLRPEGFFDKIGAAIGFQDIDFDNHPEFSKSFVLKGDNEPTIRRFFDDEMLAMFAERQGITVESAPGIFIFLRGGRKKPAQIRDFMADGYAVYSAFAQRLKRATSADSQKPI